ncbi:hypothetical protein FQN51_000781 [Onygenales sp. PD_10]|nr:hypothetical protein FQN51_000781 [Onygenales sp. PD_10]
MRSLLFAGLGLAAAASGTLSSHETNVAPLDILSDLSSFMESFPQNSTGTDPLIEFLSKLKEKAPSDGGAIDSFEKVFEFLKGKEGFGKNMFSMTSDMTGGGLISTRTLDSLIESLSSDIYSATKQNGRAPEGSIYPSKSAEDAPYSLNETTLREAIVIPDDFEYCQGEKKPIILVPGTSVPVNLVYKYNLEKLFANTSYADPIRVNIPHASHDDIQVNSEYVAYAINYVSGICQNRNVSVISWSQGGINTQWSLKYWPSTREVVEDFIAISPDFRGTILADLICPDLPFALICTPAFAQQASASTFLDVFRANGGDSAYVPTTTIYSATDDIVQPMAGPLASALMSDERNVGVTNNLVQGLCPFQPAGGIYTHGTTLLNPVTWALIQDALLNPGPGNPDNIPNFKEDVCSKFVPDGVGFEELSDTLGLISVFFGEAFKYKDKTNIEPGIKQYAA